MNSEDGNGCSNFSYSLPELITANLYRDVLRKKFESFKRSTTERFDYGERVVKDFNTWIRIKIPAYRDHAPITQLTELPTLTKAQIRGSRNDFRSTDFDPTLSWTKRTTGSTGPPFVLQYSTLFHHEITLLGIPKIVHRLGVWPDPSNRIYCLTIRDKPGEDPMVRFDPTHCGGTSVRVGFDTRSLKAVRDVLSVLCLLRPFCISSNPTVFELICENSSSDELRDAGVRVVVSGGGRLAPDQRSKLERLFEARVCTAYGLSELGVVASECRFGSMHFNTTDCHPEILASTRDTQITDGVGEIALTSTNNETMPFLRYRTGDLGRMSRNQCACGDPSPVLLELIGRTVPVFFLPSGRVLSPTQFRDTFDQFVWLKEFQLIQEQVNVFVVHYETHIPISGEDVESFRTYFLAGLERGVDVVLRRHVFERDCKLQRYKTMLG